MPVISQTAELRTAPLARGERPLMVFSQQITESDDSTVNAVNAPVVSDLGRELSREFQGDGLVILNHDRLGAVRGLYMDGDARLEQGIFTRITQIAEMYARSPAANARAYWDAECGIGSAGCLTISVPTTHDIITITVLFREVLRTTRARAGEVAARLLPMIKLFFKIMSLYLEATTKTAGLATALNRSEIGVIVLDPHGSLMFANKAADDLLARADGISHNGQTLAGADYAITVRLNSAIQHAAGDRGRPRLADAGTVIELPRAQGRSLLASVINTGQDAPFTQHSTVVLLADPDRDLTPAILPICGHFNLSRSEARLACLLAGGLSLAAAAADLRIKEMTARSYLKQIFAKTDTCRQVELVRLLLTNAVGTLNYSTR